MVQMTLNLLDNTLSSLRKIHLIIRKKHLNLLFQLPILIFNLVNNILEINHNIPANTPNILLMGTPILFNSILQNLNFLL